MWIRRVRRQEELKIPLCNPSGGKLLRQSCQTSAMELLCENSQRPKHVDCFRKKAPLQTSDWILNAESKWVECKCMEFVAAGLCARKWLRLYQTTRNATSGDIGIRLVVIWLGVADLEKIRLVYLLDLFEARGEKEQCNLVCLEHLWVIGLMVVILMSYSRVVIVVLFLLGVGPVLRSSYGIEWQKITSLVSGK